MAKTKTHETTQNVTEYILQLPQEQKQKDSFLLIELLSEITGFKPKMWGPSIIGFGSYHYKYESGHEGDAPRLGFSPRKAAISLYIYTGDESHLPLVEKLGKYTMGKMCIYVKKLADIDLNVLKELAQISNQYMLKHYPL